jgi:hypothetical protein
VDHRCCLEDGYREARELEIKFGPHLRRVSPLMPHPSAPKFKVEKVEVG